MYPITAITNVSSAARRVHETAASEAAAGYSTAYESAVDFK
jgi:hypothetical protein